MKTLWEKRIEHIDRRVRPLQARELLSRLRKDAVRTRRGLPSRGIPADLALEALQIKIATRRGEEVEPTRLAKLEFALMRDRLLERKRRLRRKVRKGLRPPTKINLWRRRQEWLRQVEALERP